MGSRGVKFARKVKLTGLDGDAVISHADPHTRNIRIMAGFRIDTVRGGRINGVDQFTCSFETSGILTRTSSHTAASFMDDYSFIIFHPKGQDKVLL